MSLLPPTLLPFLSRISLTDNALWGDWYSHKDGDRTLVSHGLEPRNDAGLRHSAGEVARSQHHAPLGTGFLGLAQLRDRLLDALGGGAGNDGIVGEAGLIQLGAHARQDLKALSVGDVYRLAGRSQDYEATDTSAGQVDGVGGLRGDVDGGGGGIVVGGRFGGEKGRDLRLRWFAAEGGECQRTLQAASAFLVILELPMKVRGCGASGACSRASSLRCRVLSSVLTGT